MVTLYEHLVCQCWGQHDLESLSHSDDVDGECNEEEEKEEEEEEGEDGSALDTDTSLLGGNFSESFKACLILCAFIPVYITVEEEIDSYGFDQDRFALSRPIIRVRPSPAICIVNPEF